MKQTTKVIVGWGMDRTIKVIVGWIVACGALFFVICVLDFCLNFPNWYPPEWNLYDFGLCVLIVSVPLIAIWFLARVKHGRISLVVAIIACLLMAAIGIFSFFHERTEEGYAIFTRHSTSPLWYRSGKLFLMCLPGVFCLWGRRRHSTQHTLTRPDDPPITRR